MTPATSPATEEKLHHHGPGEDCSTSMLNRSRFLQSVAIVTIGSLLTSSPDNAAFALPSYSSNARNMERLAAGDASGGSTYDNYPKTEAGKKRRAITGCKIPSARREATLLLGSSSSLSEKECNMRVLAGETDFMLEAIRKLDCPTCPYGIDPK